MAIPIKQTAKFKAKPQSVPTAKKLVQKAVANVTGSPGTKVGMNTSLTSVAQKLNSSGVTLTQPKQTIPKPNQGKPPTQQTNIGKPRMSLPTAGQSSKMPIPPPGQGPKPLTTQQMLQALKNGPSKPVAQAQAASNKPGQAQTATKPPQAHSASKVPQAHTGAKPAQAQLGAKPPQAHAGSKPPPAHAGQPGRLTQKFPHLSITNIDLLKASPPTTQNCIPMATPKASGASSLPRQGAIPKPQNQTIPKPQNQTIQMKGTKAVATKLTALQAKQAAMKKSGAAQSNSQPGSSSSSPTASFKANKAVDAKSQLAMFKQNLIKQLGGKPAAAKQTKAAAGGASAKSGAIPKPGAGAIPKPCASGIPKPGGASLPKPQPKKQQVKPKPKPPGGGDPEIICIDID